MYPHQSYLICAPPRSGSYLLCEALTNTGLAGRPTEFFALGPEHDLLTYWGLTEKEYDQYLANVLHLGTTPNGVFGAKLIWLTFPIALTKFRMLPGCAELSEAKLLSTVFPNLQYLSITRRDKVRQAISYAKAIQTSEWVRLKDRPTWSAREPVFDPCLIDRLLQEIEREEQDMQRFFTHNGIQPFPVVYEELVMAYEATARAILQYLEIPFTEPLSFGERHIARQADAQTEEWLQRYREHVEKKRKGE